MLLIKKMMVTTKQRVPVIKEIKKWLLLQGPHSIFTQWSLKLYGLLKGGYKVTFNNGVIKFRKAHQCLVISEKDCIFAPLIMRGFFDQKFNEIEAKKINDMEVLDFSKPGTHYLKGDKIGFIFPGLADAPVHTYIDKFKPAPGMIVFDVGAHVGAISYFFSKMVGEQGKVYAFEPDEINLCYLKSNIKNKNLANVAVVTAALGGQSGSSVFFADGSMRSSFVKNAPYLPSDGAQKKVTVLTIQDCCEQLGVIPDFIKMDIEGAEIEVIKSSLHFLKEHHIHFAIESNHLTQDGCLTSDELERLFKSIGYVVESSDQFGEMFTWAAPPDPL